MAEEKKVHESRGMWSFERIGRPDVILDQRSRSTLTVSEFDRTMRERKSIKQDVISEKIGPVEVTEEL